MKRFLSLTLVILMCVAAFATFTVTSSAADQTFTKVTSAPADWTGTYLIVYEGEESTLAFNGSLETLDAVNDYTEVSVTDGKITADSSNAFTVTAVDGGYAIKSASGSYIGQESDANGLKSSATSDYLNTISFNEEDGTVDIVSCDAHLRFNASANQMRFRYYKSATYANQKAITLYKSDATTPVDPDPVDPEPSDKVVASTAEYVIFHPAANVALTATASGTKLAGVEATANENGTLTVSDDSYAVVTVTIYTDGTFTATVDGKYLTSAPTGNGISLADTATEYSYWTIDTETASGYSLYKNVAANYNGKAQYLEYYNGFTTYGAPASGKESAYVFNFYEKAKVSVAGEVVDPDPVDPDPVDPEKTVVSVNKIVVFLPSMNLAMSATLNGSKLEGVEATANENGTLTVPGNGHAVWTATVYSDGTFTLATSDGKYLTSKATGNGVSLEETANEYSYWTFEDVNGVTLYKNVAANYNGKAQYLEYYNGFTTYGAPSAGNEAAYTFTAFESADVNPEPGVDTGDATAIIAVLAIVALFGTAVIVKKVHD